MKKYFFMATTALVLIGLLVVPACGGNGNGNGVEPEYNLTMTVSPAGSGTTTPTGTTKHEEGAVVNVAATPNAGYLFVDWNATVGAVADPDAASTTYTMPAEGVTLTANFKEVPSITFAVTGPMTFIQGQDHWEGALMARDAINSGGGVDVGGVTHMIDLKQVDTNEILDLTGEIGRTALLSVIDDVDFVVGGFRTESVAVYRLVAVGPPGPGAGAGKIMMNTGAATAALQASVVLDYPNFKYWFKATPYNEVFLVTSVLKYTGIINSVLRGQLGLGAEDPGLRVAILMENASWSNPMEPFAVGGLTAMGMDVVGVFKCESGAGTVQAQLNSIRPFDPHVIFTVLSGPPGKAYGFEQAAAEGVPNAFSVGINVEAQDIDYHEDTGAKYHVTLDTWAELVEVTPLALDFFDAFVAKTTRYPTYCAATYDAIHSIIEGVEAVSATGGWDDIADVIDHDNIDALIQFLETNVRVGVGARTGYYPLPGGALPTEPPTPHLTFAQAKAIYPHLVESDPGSGEFLYNPVDFTLQGGFIAHDTIYGPGWQTGIAAQWQPVDPENPEGAWRKVAVWPMPVGAPLVDKYGDWNFAYAGTQPLMIDPAWVAHHSS